MVPTPRRTTLCATRDEWQSEPVEDPATLRAMMRRRRRAIPSPTADERAAAAAAQFRGLVRALPGALASYFASDGELDPRPVNELVESAGGAVYVPVCGEDLLRFARYRDGSPTAPNRYAIPEPVGVATVGADALDVIVVPLVAFDRHGHRLGMGGGWYDRTLGVDTRAPRPLLVGFAHDEQELDALTPQSWDVTMDAIVTPTRAWWTAAAE
jgi:5-formyltetrahydrofolate cyclo-ligase